VLKKVVFVFYLLFLLIGFNKGYASHLLGGEITWVCLKSGANTGKYEFYLKVYRDCNGISLTTTGNVITYFNGTNGAQMGTIAVNMVSQTDISPKCYNAAQQITCGNPQNSPAAVEEFIFKSAPTTITGIPPSGGFIFTWNDCCRSGSITNINNPSSEGHVLRAIMYPYQNRNANPCFDSSPDFAEKPSTSLPTGYKFTFNNNANDAEFDSLAYAWAQPLGSIGGSWPATPSSFSSGYSVNSQLPSQAQNAANMPPVIDQNQGEVTFKSLTTGVFATVLKVTAYKCGTKVAEVYRDIQVSLSNAVAGNNVPIVAPPFTDAFGNYTEFTDTVYAGQLVNFSISATDNDIGTGTSQYIFTAASGIQFGSGFTSSTAGCLIPPCATLTPVPSATTGQQFASLTTFNWQTTCDHLKYGSPCKESNVYKFVIKTRDNICPVPAIQYSTITIVVIPPPPLKAPEFHCVSVNSNGSVALNWKPIANDTANIFNSYQIYYSLNRNGPYQLADSIFNINTTSLTHSGVNAQNQSVYYFIKTRFGCRGTTLSESSDTLQTLFVTANVAGTNAVLNWNHTHAPKLSSNAANYRVYRESPPGTWTLLGNTTNTTFSEPAISTCTDTIRYRVEIDDNLPCTNVSNLAFLNSNTPIAPPELRCLKVNKNGSIDLTWMNPVNNSSIFGKYILYTSNSAFGSFTVFDSITNYSVTNSNHLVAGGNSAPVYYFVKSKSNCTVATTSIPSDTLKSIFLTVNRAGQSVSLNWNALRTPGLTSASNQYKIYRKLQGAAWTLLNTVATLSFSERAVQGCNDTVYYRIETDDNLPCTSVSNEAFYITDTDIPPPVLRCVSINANGSVNLSWKDTSNSATVFAGYYIYKATASAGPYTLIDSVLNYATNTYLYNVANGQTQRYWFYLKSRTSCGSGSLSVSGDTLSSIIISVTNNGGTAQLSWNPLRTPKLPTSVGLYTVYREYPKGVWTSAGTTNATTYTDNFTVCADSIYYRVEIDDNLPCTSVSNVKGAFFQDLVPPVVPKLDSVSVDITTGHTVIGWNPSTSGDTYGYIIYYYNGTNYVQIDTVIGRTNTNYVFLNSNPSASSETYTVSAIDSCGNTSDFDIKVQKTMFLQGFVDICKGDITLRWTKYINWNPTVTNYEIFASENGGNFTNVGSRLSSDSSFIHKNVNKGSTYCYYIRATNGIGGKTSTSNKFCITATVPNPPQWTYAIYATVKKDAEIEVSGLANLGADLKGFRIYKAIDDTAWSAFSAVTVKNPLANNSMLYNDDAVETQKYSYAYRLVLLDSCGAESLHSNLAKTILLRVKPNLDVSHELSWTPYLQWPQGVEKYNIYRIKDDSGDTILVANVGGEHLAYKDAANIKYDGMGKYCYMVEAVENSGNTLGFKAISRSNWQCVNQEATVYIPNAFNPADVYNRTFKPVITFADTTSYVFEIYDRWGQKIFDTTDINVAWDGTIKGDKAPADIYAYRVTFKTYTGVIIKRNGTVVLIR